MQAYDDMLRSLPVAYRRDAWVVALLSALGTQDEAQRQAARDTAAQVFPDAMTWALAIEERVAGLPSGASAPIEERRSALIAKWRSMTGKSDLEKIRAICGSWQGVAAQVDYHAPEYRIEVLFRSWDGMPTNMETVRQALRAVIPAHLAFTVLARLMRETQAVTRLAAAGVRAKHYGQYEVKL